ncbi:hypothetical protein O181_003955 [Austropuccinia psidii MF-1]|uniref:Uncharacterized protein n=1 Tax=Austropuccinia psidii MF-1 TaxID=1389203 RepID=A0A9Q3BFE6_9BASI|nr:hypothetical protein [Austropuccinia psidii MF-1]
MPQPMPQTLGNLTELNELPASGLESGSEISYMVSSNEVGMEVESLEHENNQNPPILLECAHKLILNISNLSKPDDFFIAFISAKPLSSQKPNLKRQSFRKTPDINHIIEATKDSLDQGDDIINLEADHNDNEGPKAETPATSPQNIQTSKESKNLKNDAMGQDMNDIVPEPEPKVSTSTNYQEII